MDDVPHSGNSEPCLSFTTSVVPEGMTKKQWKKQLRQQRKEIMRETAKWVGEWHLHVLIIHINIHVILLYMCSCVYHDW